MIPSSRTSSPVPSIPQSLASYLPPTSTDTTPEATVDDAPQCEFDIDWENIWHCGKRLVGVKKRPRHRRVVGTKMKESWIYRHGANLEHKGVRYWLCRLCHEKRSYSTALYASSGTAHAARHLLRQHQIAEFGDSSPSLTTPFTLAAASASSSVRALSRQASLGFQLGSHFDERSWKARFVDWIILEDVTFRQASSERLRWLIANGGELASQLLPEHHTTVCSWIRLTFESRRQIIFNLVKDAKSSVHLSFDLWTASNGFHYIGIVGHFVDTLELRSAIELYQSRWQKPKNDPVHRDLTKDFLSAVDWAELERFHDFLKPSYILTKTMEGNASKPGAEGGHGAVWETLKTMDYLFVKFKQAAEETQFEEPSHFKSGIDCGWAKLEDYYIKTDRTPIYRAALALHSSYGYDYFERHWKTAMDRPQWYSDMQSAVGSLFDEYIRQAEVETQAQAGLLEDEADEIEADVNDYSSFGKRSIRSLHTQRKKVKAADLDRQTESLDKPRPTDRRGRSGSVGLLATLIENTALSLEDKTTYDVITDNATRWNSSEAMMERGYMLRNALDSLVQAEVTEWNQYVARRTQNGTKPMPKKSRKKPAIVDDKMAAEDWSVIAEYLAILKSLKIATKRLEGRPQEGKFGAIWEVLLTMEWLLKHLEEAKLQHERDEEPYLRIGCKLGWMKLDQYYSYTEDSPAYLAALVLHPAFRWSTVESQWADQPDWLVRGKKAVQELWEEYRNLFVEQDALPEQPTVVRKTTDLDDFMASIRKLSTQPAPSPSALRDEYAEWIATSDPGDCLVDDPIQSWLLRRRQYPRLSRMAIDLFSIPAMSSEPERIFSLAGQMVTPQRGRLKADLIGTAQCISSWEESGVIQISK
ncbi:HAT, C-terminal dimerization domain [Fusarium oxysporum f. sp. vasinfectum]|nr:HAT, C-terminal dimerization domain [Fusarium oxysporum f. sp. vasinfectum]